MFMSFVTEVNMIIMNTFPVAKGLFTRFMNNSGLPGTRSLLDYGMVDGDHSNTVTSFTIDENARFDCGSDHALLECDIEFGARPKVAWTYQEALQFKIYDDTNFTEFHKTLDILSSSIRLESFTNLEVEQMLPHISETLIESTKKCFKLKIKKKPSGNQLPRNIINLIRLKNASSRAYNHAIAVFNTDEAERLLGELETLKQQVRDGIADIKLGRRQRLRNKLLKADPTRKRFWRFLKSQTKAAGTITALNDTNGKMVFEQSEIQDVILQHFGEIFKGSRHPILVDETLNNQEELCLAELDVILSRDSRTFTPDQFEDEVCSPYTFIELDQILKKLPKGKSAGYDMICNEVLRNVSTKFKHYLLLFLNKIISSGTIPPDLNVGKCILIFKVLKFKIKLQSTNNFPFRGATPSIPPSTGPSPFPLTSCAWSLSGCARR